MTPQFTIVADVFRHENQAKHALEALRQAGFGYDQIGIAMHGHEGIDLQSDLENLGVPHDEASYYVQEVKAGHTVISVRPDGRDQEAHEIMRQSGALVGAESGASQQEDTIDKQKAAWEQAIASHQAYLAQQRALKLQEDFHQPRSLKPRLERMPETSQQVQVEQAQQSTTGTQQQPDVAPVTQQEEVTQQKPVVTPPVENVTEQKPVVMPLAQDDEATEPRANGATAVQNNSAQEQSPLREEMHPEIVSRNDDDEETLHRAKEQEQDKTEKLPAQTQLAKGTNGNMVRTGIIVGGLLLGVGAGAVIALLRGRQIRQFFLARTQMVQKQIAANTKK